MKDGYQLAKHRPGNHAKTFVHIQATAWARSSAEVKGKSRSLLVTLATHSDDFGCSFCSRRTLAMETGCSVRTVAKHLNDLEELGLIRRIGRFNKHDGRLTSVVHLCAWPDRRILPQKGHPKLGPTIKEDKYTALQLAFDTKIHRQSGHQGWEEPARINKTTENILLTPTPPSDLLEDAFDALGGWATAENQRFLEDDIETLLAFVAAGHSVEHVILPTLARKVDKSRRTPELRTWRYFEKAFEAEHQMLRKRRADKISPVKQRYAVPADIQSDTAQPVREASDGFTNEVGRILRNTVKNFGPSQSGGDE